MSDAMSMVPEDHPLMKAWKVHQATVDFANSKRWAAVPEHLQGSLWALFYAGYHAALTEGRRQGLEEAAKFIDCGCGERAAVLVVSTSAEQRRACGHIPCAAADAAGIRALIKEPKA